MIEQDLFIFLFNRTSMQSDLNVYKTSLEKPADVTLQTRGLQEKAVRIQQEYEEVSKPVYDKQFL